MKVAITDQPFGTLGNEAGIFAQAGVEVVQSISRDPSNVINSARDADALLVNMATITSVVIAELQRCRVIVRYGIGLDNIDVDAASARGIAVCNVPDYASGEVADHALALALALARQIPLVDARLRRGQWRITPDFPLLAFPESNFVTLGYGRIAREVAKRARSFGFKTAAYDPFVDEAVLQKDEVRSLSLHEALAMADILSLHLPLNSQTRHVINDLTLATMKPAAIIINTARGGLIDADALARALVSGKIFAAGLDVFDHEPLPVDSPLRTAPRTLLTSHLAWYSEASASRLQTMAAQEVVRGLRGEPLRSQVNFSSCFDSTKKSL